MQSMKYFTCALSNPNDSASETSGGGGIRTHVTLAGRGLANLCHRPLGDASSSELALVELYQRDFMVSKAWHRLHVVSKAWPKITLVENLKVSAN